MGRTGFTFPKREKRDKKENGSTSASVDAGIVLGLFCFGVNGKTRRPLLCIDKAVQIVNKSISNKKKKKKEKKRKSGVGADLSKVNFSAKVGLGGWGARRYMPYDMLKTMTCTCQYDMWCVLVRVILRIGHTLFHDFVKS